MIDNRNACKHYFQDFICLFVNADLTFELMQVRLLLPMMHALILVLDCDVLSYYFKSNFYKH